MHMKHVWPVLLLMLCLCTVATASQEHLTGEYTYIVLPNGGARIIRYEPEERQIKTVTVPDILEGHPVTVIGEGVFRGMEMESVILPDTVVLIEQEAFASCSALKSIRIPQSLNRISSLAFAGCSGLECFRLSAAVATLGENPFAGCRSLKLEVDPQNENFRLTDGFLYSADGILLSVQGHPEQAEIRAETKKIGPYAFAYQEKLSSIRFSENLQEIGDHAFDGCTALAQIDLPDSLKMIGAEAFRHCDSLTSVTLPSSLSWFSNPFTACQSLKKILVADNHSYLCSNDGILMFGGTAILAYPPGREEDSFTVPSGCSMIGEQAFSGSRRLVKIKLPDSVVSICEGAFDGCERLKEINLENVWEIEKAAFSGCRALKRIELSDHIYDICDQCFDGFIGLKTIKMPAHLQSIGVSAFRNCSNLTEIDIPDCVRDIGENAFERCSSLTYVKLPHGMRHIKSGTFCGCDSLTEVDMPFGLVSIADGAFEGCAMLAVARVPGSVIEIGEKAFDIASDPADSSLTIVAPSNTYAEKYAEEKGIAFGHE